MRPHMLIIPVFLCAMSLIGPATPTPALQAASSGPPYVMTWTMTSSGSSQWTEDHDNFQRTEKATYTTTVEADVVYYAYPSGSIATRKELWWLKVSHTHTEQTTDVYDDRVSNSSWSDTIIDPLRYNNTGFFAITLPGVPIQQTNGSFVISDPFKNGQHPRPLFTSQITIVDSSGTQQQYTEQSMLACASGVTDSWTGTSPGDLTGDGQVFTASKQIDKASPTYPAHIEWTIQIKRLSNVDSGDQHKIYLPFIVRS